MGYIRVIRGNKMRFQMLSDTAELCLLVGMNIEVVVECVVGLIVLMSDPVEVVEI